MRKSRMLAAGLWLERGAYVDRDRPRTEWSRGRQPAGRDRGRDRRGRALGFGIAAGYRNIGLAIKKSRKL